MDRSAAPWQAEITPMGFQPCPWVPCGLIKEAILSHEAPASLLLLLSDIWSLSTVPRTHRVCWELGQTTALGQK